MNKKNISLCLLFLLVILLSWGVGFFCSPARRSDKVFTDTLEVEIVLKDTIEVEVETVRDSIIYLESGDQRHIVTFHHEDSLISISGTTTSNPPESNIKYYIKPISFNLVNTDTGGVQVIATSDMYNVEVTGRIERIREFKKGFYINLGGGYQIETRRIQPSVGIGYSFGRVGFQVGITGEYLTSGFNYYF